MDLGILMILVMSWRELSGLTHNSNALPHSIDDYSWIFLIRWIELYYGISWISLIVKNEDLFWMRLRRLFEIVSILFVELCIWTSLIHTYSQYISFTPTYMIHPFNIFQGNGRWEIHSFCLVIQISDLVIHGGLIRPGRCIVGQEEMDGPRGAVSARHTSQLWRSKDLRIDWDDEIQDAHEISASCPELKILEHKIFESNSFFVTRNAEMNMINRIIAPRDTFSLLSSYFISLTIETKNWQCSIIIRQ